MVAAAGGQAKLAVPMALGAPVAVDYTAADWTAAVRAKVGAVDVIFDGVGGAVGLDAFGLLRDGGRCYSFGMASGEFAPISAGAAADRRITVEIKLVATKGEVDCEFPI